MDKLRELAQLVTKNKLKSIDILDLQSSRKSKVVELYEKIVNDEVDSDEAASLALFPGKKPGGAQYRKVKAGLKSRLINSLFFIDVKKANFNDRQTAHLNCFKDWAAANILLGKHARNSGIELCHRILRHAERYEFTELCRDVTKALRLHYGSMLGDYKQYNYYRDYYRKLNQVVEWEDEAEFAYTDVIINYVNGKSDEEAIRALAQQYYDRLAPALAECDAYRLHLYAGLIRLMTHSIVNDFQGVRKAAQEMSEFFEAKEYDAEIPLQISYYYQLVANTQLREFAAGKAVAEKCLARLKEGSFNWFKYYELYFLLAMHTGEYGEAYRVFTIVINHSRLRHLPQHAQEIWKIYEAHLHYLIASERVTIPASDTRFTKFRLGRFLNETPIYSRDKRGLNVAILSIQILFLLQQQKFGRAIDKMEAIEKYCSRYLNQADTIRSYYFIKMLLSIAQGSFHRVAAENKAERYAKKLRAIPLEEANQNFKIEIIPYEELWSMALDSLGTKIYRARG